MSFKEVPKPDFDESSGGFSVFKVFLVFAFLGLTVFGGVYLFRRYQLQNVLSLPSFPSFQLDSFESQR